MGNMVYSRQDKLRWYHWTIFLSEVLSALTIMGFLGLILPILVDPGTWSPAKVRVLGGLPILALMFLRWMSSTRRIFLRLPVLDFNQDGIQYLRTSVSSSDRSYFSSASPLLFSDIDRIEHEFEDRVVIRLKDPLNKTQAKKGAPPVNALVVAGNSAGLKSFLDLARSQGVLVNDSGPKVGDSQDRQIAVVILTVLSLLFFTGGIMFLSIRISTSQQNGHSGSKSLSRKTGL